MARTPLTIQTPKGPYPGSVAAEALDITWEAGDATNNNEIAATGKELLLVRNDDVGAQTFTLVSAADPFKRSADITAYSLGAGEYAAFWLGALTGWIQSDRKFHLNPGNANLKFAVLKMPEV